MPPLRYFCTLPLFIRFTQWLEAVLEYEANPLVLDLTDSSGRTPLSCKRSGVADSASSFHHSRYRSDFLADAAYGGHIGVVEILLEKS